MPPVWKARQNIFIKFTLQEVDLRSHGPWKRKESRRRAWKQRKSRKNTWGRSPTPEDDVKRSPARQGRGWDRNLSRVGYVPPLNP